MTISDGKKHLVHLSHSEQEGLLTCEHYWRVRYVDRLVPLVAHGAYVRGRWAHAAMERAMRAIMDPLILAMPLEAVIDHATKVARDAVGQEIAKYGQLQLARVPAELVDEFTQACAADARLHAWMVEHALRAILPEDMERREVVAVELPFDLPIPGRKGRVRGVLDLVTRERQSGFIELQEHKTFASSTDNVTRRLDRDPQTMLYLWAMRELQARGELPDGQVGTVVFNVMRRAMPQRPELTKKGLVSAAQIDTTAEIYREALEAQGEPPTEAQASRLADLERRPDTYFRRHETWFEADAIARALADLERNVARARHLHLHPDEARRNLYSCTSPRGRRCEYEAICSAPSSPEARAQYETRDEQRAREEAREAWAAAHPVTVAAPAHVGPITAERRPVGSVDPELGF